jgi:GTP cyclohydrolase III
VCSIYVGRAPFNTREFDFVEQSFPAGAVELRLNPAEYIEDFDRAVSAQVYLTTTQSTFHCAHMDIVDRTSTVSDAVHALLPSIVYA